MPISPPAPAHERSLRLLVAGIAALATVATAVGVFSTGGTGPREVTTIGGRVVDLYGTGLYRDDTWLIGAGNRGTDAATLFLEIPLLLVSLVWFRRGSLRGHLLLTGALAWFLYYYASMSLATAYNGLYLVYLATFSLSFFAFVLAFTSLDAEAVHVARSPRFPRKALGVYLFVVPALLTFAWLPALVGEAFGAETRDLVERYTSDVTSMLDLGIIVPSLVLAAVAYRRRTPLGSKLGVFLVLFNLAIGVALLGQGIAQLVEDVPLTAGEKVGYIGSFGVLTLVSVVLSVAVLRTLDEPGDRPQAP